MNLKKIMDKKFNSDTPRVWQTLSGDELKELLQTPGAVSNFFAKRDSWDRRRIQKLYPTKYGKIYDVYGDDVVYDADYEDIVAAIVDIKESGYRIQVVTTDYEDPDGTFGEKVRRDVDAMMYQTNIPDQLSDSRKVMDYNTKFVGAQNFTYFELEQALEVLKEKVEADPDNLPDNKYELRVIYRTDPYNPQDEDNWDFEPEFTIPFDDAHTDELIQEIEYIPLPIVYGELQILTFLNGSELEDDWGNHSIVIDDGKITRVY